MAKKEYRTASEQEKKYWDFRYSKGVTSGRGLDEVGGRNELLWAAIEKELPEINHIVDVGCGDLNIWGDRNCEDYVGVDIAQEILQENKNKHPSWTFICTSAEVFIPKLVRENVFCFNLVYHILSSQNIIKVFRNLCRYATKRIFIYTWITNPFRPEVTDRKYQYYHPVGRYLPLFNEMGFELASVEWIVQPIYTAEELLELKRSGLERTPSGLYIFKPKSAVYEKYPATV